MSEAAVLLVAHGTVENLDDLPEFVARIRHGRPPPAGLIAELRRRYETIGGSPLLKLTEQQAKSLEAKLGVPVLVAMRLWQPTVEQQLKQAASQGLRRLCVLPLAPFSVSVYAAAAERSRTAVLAELGERAPALVHVEPWGCEPAFVEAYAARIRELAGPRDAVILTAHSLPLRAIREGDRYEVEVRACADAVARACGQRCELAFQSQGADGGEWLGPDLLDALASAKQAGVERVVVAPIGFLAEHVETLYDLDREARAQCEQLGMAFARISTLNTDPGLINALARVANNALEQKL